MAKRNQQKEFAIIGLGRFGSSLAIRLEELGHSVLAIDRRRELIQNISPYVTQSAALDAANEDALRAVDIATFPTVIVGVGDDFEASLLITHALKKLGVKSVICKANTNRQMDILLRIGADRVIQPEQDLGAHLAESLSAPHVLAQVPLGFKHKLMEIEAPMRFINKSIKQANIRQQYMVTILIIKRGDVIFASPTPDTIIQENDTLIVLGDNDHVSQFCNLK